MRVKMRITDAGKVLYEMYCSTQLENNNCEEITWEALDECDKQCWRDTAHKFEESVLN